MSRRHGPGGRPATLELTQTALFLDLDGTLIPLSDSPRPVRADAGCIALLRRAAALLEGRMAIVSGRDVGAVDEILDGAAIAVAGVHGLQHRGPCGRRHDPAPHPALPAAQEALEAFAAARPGLVLETKPLALALHFRRAPELGEGALQLAERLARRLGLVLQAGDMVAELRTPGADKGVAVRRFMRAAPFRGARPLFLGDDLTDEAGFAAAAALGGMGVLVGAARPSRASARLPGPDTVRGWLADSLERGFFDLREAR